MLPAYPSAANRYMLDKPFRRQDEIMARGKFEHLDKFIEPLQAPHYQELQLGHLGLFAELLQLGRPILADWAIIGLAPSWFCREILAFNLAVELASTDVDVACTSHAGWNISEQATSIGTAADFVKLLTICCAMTISVDTRRLDYDLSQKVRQ